MIEWGRGGLGAATRWGALAFLAATIAAPERAEAQGSEIPVPPKSTAPTDLDADPARGAISFSAFGLQGESSTNPTSLQFGPDGRLYVAQQNGMVYVYTVVRNTGPVSYTVFATESIDLVKNIPNHNDDGTNAPGETDRQVTALLVAGTAPNPVLYVGSSDPRIAVNDDSGLDTNSGVLSRLSWNGSSWDHVQLVRGFPRSEENHSNNGMILDAGTNTLYMMVGGNTNKGAPSNNFSRTPEYALSAALVSIDLDVIDAMPIQQDVHGDDYAYDLPTLDDPTVPGAESYDPWGGNNGLNQARWDPLGPVQVFATGFRNAYDVMLHSNGNLYTYDNGPNGAWGGTPVNEGQTDGGGNSLVTNEAKETGDEFFPDRLLLISGQGYYGGHPHPTRANPDGSGLFIYEKISGTWTLTSSWNWVTDFPVPPVPFAFANAVEGDYLDPTESGSLATVSESTNGVCEYTATNFGGAMQGQLLAASFDGNVIRYQLNGPGDQVLSSANVGNVNTPLDVWALGDADPFPGTIWTADHMSSTITIYEPTDYDGGAGGCTGAYSFALDEDSDGYSNADEIDAGTDPCAGASIPPDHDGDFVSDVTDTDDDDDSILDVDDEFALDPQNGLGTPFPVHYGFSINGPDVVPGTFFSVGFTGLMTNGSSDYLDQFDSGSMAAGGAAGFVTVENVPETDAFEAVNNQEYAFQFGIDADTNAPAFVAHTRLQPPFFGSQTPEDYQSFGLQVGPGDQDNYAKAVLAANGGAGGVEVLIEIGGSITSAMYGPGVTGDLLNAGTVDLYMSVDPQALTIQPQVSIDGGTVITGLGSPLSVPASWLDPNDAQGLAVGIIATSWGAGPPFNATWDLIEVTSVPTDAAATLSVTGGGAIDASTWSPSSFQLTNDSTSGQTISKVTIDLSSAIFPDMVFDPDGTAGDDVAKPFTVDIDPGVGGISHQFFGAHGNGGWDVLEVTFSGGGFDPGETLEFSIDVDPNSIQGTSSPGPGDSGSVSGLELLGVSVTIEFSDATAIAGDLWADGSPGGGVAVIESNLPPQPALALVGIAAPAVVSSASHTLRITGPANGTAHVVRVEGALFEPGGGGFDIDPFEANSAVVVQEITNVILNGSGTADVGVTLTRSDSVGGINSFMAVIDGSIGRTSAPLVVEYDPAAATTCPIARLNSGDGTFVDGSGATWAPDQYFDSGTSYTSASSIAGTTDDALYQDARVGDFSYDVPVPSGSYDVSLLFAELIHGVENGNGAGSRVFDVTIEGTLALDDFDILSETAPATALTKSIDGVVVADGKLTITFLGSVDDPIVSAVLIETAAGVTQALLAASTGVDLGLQLEGTTTEASSVNLAAFGEIGLDVTDVSIVGPDASSFSHDLSTPFSMAGCSFDAFGVTFTPAGPGGKSADLVLTHTGDNSPVTVALVGEGLGIAGTTPLVRVNAGGSSIGASDGGPDWAQDTAASPHPAHTGGSNVNSYPGGTIDASVPAYAPSALYDSERWDPIVSPEMTWTFSVPAGGDHVVNLFLKSGYSGTSQPGDRIFDVDVEGVRVLDDYDVVATHGHQNAVMRSFVTNVTDGDVVVEFIHDLVENPFLNGIEIRQVTPASAGDVTVTIDPGVGIESATETTGAFTITNNSASALQVTRVDIDLSTAIFGDLLFDPAGTAGDTDAKALTPDAGAGATGYVTPGDPAVDPFSSPRDGGFEVVGLSFGDFDPGESFSFSVDVDPTSIRGAPGTSSAGDVSGLELSGATVVVTFANATTFSAETFRIPASEGGSVAIVRASPPPAPTLQVLGLGPSPVSTDVEAHSVRVTTGQSGVEVALLVVEGGLVLDGAPGGGFDLDPFEANRALVVGELTGTTDATGYVDIPVTLTFTDPAPDPWDTGLNHLRAVVREPDGRTGIGSQTFLVDFQPIILTDSVSVAVPPGVCLPATGGCVAGIAFDIARETSSELRSFSVTFAPGADLALCDSTNSIVEGPYLASVGTTTFDVTDHLDGTYTVDGAITGEPCGPTAATGTLFTIDVTSVAGGSAVGSVSVTGVVLEACDGSSPVGAPGTAGAVTIEGVPPAAISGLTSTQSKSANPGTSTTPIVLDWTSTAEGDAAAVTLYRKGFGFHPEYDDSGGAVPVPPAVPGIDGWGLVATLAPADTTYQDTTSVRDFHYYVAFVSDSCGNLSAPSALADDGRRGTPGTLNYHLGDVSDGITVGSGDNLVDAIDVSFLGANYGIEGADVDSIPFLDFGPTVGGSVDGLPVTDGEVGFEELALIAINYDAVSREGDAFGDLAGVDPERRLSARVRLDLERIDEDHVRVVVELMNNPGTIRAIHAVVLIDEAEVLEITPGEAIQVAGRTFFTTLEEEAGLGVHAAVLGPDVAFPSGGELASMLLRVGESARTRLSLVDMRDERNRKVGDSSGGWQALPSAYAFLGAFPNPFNPRTRIVFRLPESAPVRITIFDVAGRRVKQLADRTFPIGEHAVVWDGRDESGKPLGSGVYLYRIRAGDIRATEKLVMIR